MQPRNISVRVAVSRDELEAWQTAAARNDRSLSSYVRIVVNAHLLEDAMRERANGSV